MKYELSQNCESVSVEGIEYEVRKGVVELPNTLSPATVGHLVNWHGFTPIAEEAKPAKGAKVPDAAPEVKPEA